MCVRETKPRLGKAIDVGRLNRRRTIGGDIAVAEIVGHDEDDVRPVLSENVGYPGDECCEDGGHAANTNGNHRWTPSLEMTSRTTACGRWLTVRNILPRYSPIKPSLTICVPEKIRKAGISQPKPYQGPRLMNHSHSTAKKATTPRAAVVRPANVASRSGSSEKFSHAPSHKRKSPPQGETLSL